MGKIKINESVKVHYKFGLAAFIWFKDIVSQRNMTLTQAAKELNMSIQRLSNIINGRCFISKKTADKIIMWAEGDGKCEKPTQN